MISDKAKNAILTLSDDLDTALSLSQSLDEFLQEGLMDIDSDQLNSEAAFLHIEREDYYRDRLLLELGCDEKQMRKLARNRRLVVKELAGQDYADRPFIRALQGVSIDQREYHLYPLEFQPLESFLLTDVNSSLENGHFSTETTLGYFLDKQIFPALRRGRRIWMSGTPYEFATMDPFIEEAHGKVLTLGLGMGYFATESLRKKEVTSVTAIDNSSEVIALFQKQIEPRIGLPRRVQIIQGDAWEYLQLHGREFDYIFADLWHDEIDGTPMLIKLEQMGRTIDREIKCWIAPTMLTFIRENAIQALTLLATGETPEPIDGPLVAKLFNLYAKEDFTAPDDVYKALQDSSLTGILASL
ncbi:MAG TPA: hypothetical protein DEA32_01915 [Firmicutes bacterium]|nr:hypothetical protein [Bacillota bacterium]